MSLVARSAPVGGECQTYENHVSGVRKIALSFARKVSKYFKDKNLRNTFLEITELAAEYHDTGKTDQDNQNALIKNNLAHLPYPHWEDGAFYIKDISKDAAMVSLAHHSCLDRKALNDLVKNGKPRNSALVALHKQEMLTSKKGKSYISGNKIPVADKMFVNRMALSCLVNGDWDDSARAKNAFVPECQATRWLERLDKLEKTVVALNQEKADKLSSMNQKDPLVKFQTERNCLRKELWDNVGDVGVSQDISVLSATVGMGKTFSFLRLALRQAIKNNSPHIFVVAPYNHIVDQLIDVLRRTLVLDGEDPEEIIANHTCTAEYHDWQVQNASSRWRCPIIITSSVQFFETMSSNVAGKLVKLVEVPNSVVVIDEWHSVMEENLSNFYWEEMGYLSSYFKTKFILSSGSMTRYWSKQLNNKFVNPNNVRIKEIVSKSFARRSVKSEKGRVKYVPLGNVTADMLADDVLKYGGLGKKTIVLMSTTKNVAVMAKRLIGNGRNVYTVFGSLIDDDSNRNVASIRQDNSDWIVICTTSIESGIDINAECAYSVKRSIMSQVQLGGRVNREGNYKDAKIYYFGEIRGDFNTNQSFQQPAIISDPIIEKISNSDVSTMEYLNNFHLVPNRQLLAARQGLDFPSVSKESRVIKDGRGNALVGDKAKEIFQRLTDKANGKPVKVSMKEISKNSVPMPSLDGASNPTGFLQENFLPVPGFEMEDGKSSLMYYTGGYDPFVFGIWKDKENML